MSSGRLSPALALGLLLLGGCADAPPGSPLTNGRWDAWLESPGGRLPFELEITGEVGAQRATLINGTERIEVPRLVIEGDQVTLRIDHYDSAIVATLGDDGERLDGRWTRTAGPDQVSRLEFHATPSATIDANGTPRTTSAIEGRWTVDFADEEHPAVGIFTVEPDGQLMGTFLLTTGDYRWLAGDFDGERLTLSTFDGAHAFLFEARLQADGSLAGDFWSRDTFHDTWVARRDEDARLPDAFELTSWVEGVDMADVRYPDLDGQPRALNDPEYAGGARLLVIFGTWCPNCNDASKHLVELDRLYRDRGLSILGLAFEHTGDFERDARQVRLYREYNEIEYPVLVAGLSDKEQASMVMPLIDRVRSFPTVIFLDAEDRVRAIHQGYSGPATGAAHERLRLRFTELIEELLAEPPQREG